MKKLALVMVAALMTMIATASPGGAITYGEPDGGEHPYVGFMIFFDPTEAELVQLYRHAARCRHAPDRRALHIWRRYRW